MEAVNALKINFQEYEHYEQGWNGEDGQPLTAEVKGNFRQVLHTADAASLSNIMIFPEDNGTLSIEAKNRPAGLSLGNEEFSHYAIIDSHGIGENHVPFTPEAVSELLRSFLTE